MEVNQPLVTLVEATWPRVQQLLSVFASRLVAVEPSLIHRVYRVEGGVYLLRAFLSLKKSPKGDEIAVTVEALNEDYKVRVVADACFEDGALLSHGPTLAVLANASESDKTTALARWLQDFDQFLAEIEPSMAMALGRLT